MPYYGLYIYISTYVHMIMCIHTHKPYVTCCNTRSMIQWPLHLKLGFKMVVPPWLRKPPFNDVLIDHMSDVPLVSNMSGCFSTPIMAARISPCVPSFSLGVQSQFSVSCSQLEISSQAWFKCSFERLNHFSAIVWFSKPTHFYHILPHPDIWFFHSLLLLTTFYHFPQTLVPCFPHTHKFPSNQIRFTSGPPWKSQRRSKLKSL